jgi:hypothetical protein
MKILNLVLYSDNIFYNQMYEILSKFYENYNYVQTIFYKYDENLNSDIEIKNNILLIKGKESIIPGCLHKTIVTFKWIKDNINLNDFDYIIRQNISTIINFDKLKNILIDNKFNYGSGLMLNLNWIDSYSGINDKKYFGLNFASGTSIILDKNTFKYILENSNYLNYEIVDDVAIGDLIKNYPNIIKNDMTKYFIFIEKINETEFKNNLDFYINNYIFFRNKNNDRNIDIINMNLICDNLKKMKFI